MLKRSYTSFVIIYARKHCFFVLYIKLQWTFILSISDVCGSKSKMIRSYLILIIWIGGSYKTNKVWPLLLSDIWLLWVIPVQTILRFAFDKQKHIKSLFKLVSWNYKSNYITAIHYTRVLCRGVRNSPS